MHCNSLMVPTEASCFHFCPTTPPPFLTTTKPDPYLNVNPCLRLKPVQTTPATTITRMSFKTKATVQERMAASEISFYELLGIPETGSLIEIKQAYKQLALKYHPDVSPPDRVDEYTQRFIQVQEAYETLSDPRRRALYDRDMARGLHLAFSARRRYQNHEEVEVSGEWKNRWEAQLSELKRRSMNKDSEENMSWAARMRRQREQL